MPSENLFLGAKEVLLNTMNIINRLSSDEYTYRISLLGNSSIGEHTRHIIELFQQLLNGYEENQVDYDNRNRNKSIEEDKDYACECIAEIITALEMPNRQILLKNAVIGDDKTITTSYYRELLYNIEHCIHHQAIIKIGLLYLDKDFEDPTFGVAKSTLIFKNNECKN